MISTTSSTTLTKNYVCKVQLIKRTKLASVIDRIESILQIKPVSLSMPLEINVRKFSSQYDLVRLTFEKVHGVLLSKYLKEATPDQIEKITNLLLETVENWCKNFKFIHGDISPGNILVTCHNSPILIDWLLDIESFTGTPRYSSSEVIGGHHSFESDRFAVLKIIEEIQVIYHQKLVF